MTIGEAQAGVTLTRTEVGEQYSLGAVVGAEMGTAKCGQTKAGQTISLEAVVERSNMHLAYQRVMENKGAAGVDNLSLSERKGWLKQHWESVKAALLAGDYLPQRVKAVDIPRANGGTRTLGIPTVVDRLIQQAILQHLTPFYEPEFSDSSYGFRPGRSAWQAVEQAQRYVREGYRWVVDMDLEKFFGAPG